MPPKASTEFYGKIAEVKSIKLYRSINSTLFFVVSFFLVNLLNELVIAITAKLYQKTSLITFHGIERINADINWTLKSVIITFASGPIFLVFLGVIAFRIFALLKRKESSIKFFVIWVAIHCYVIAIFKIFSYVVLSRENFPVITFFVDITTESQIIVSVLSLAAMVILSLVLPKIILSTSPTHYYTKNRFRRKQYIIQVAVGPWFVGMLATIAFYFPNDFYMTSILLLLNGFLILFTYLFSSSRNNRKINLLRYDAKPSLNVAFIVILIALYAISHLALSTPKVLF